MKPILKPILALLIVLHGGVDAQSVKPALPPEARPAKVQATREARLQRAKAERLTKRQQAKEEGRKAARETRAADRQFVAVWTRLSPEVRELPHARELAQRVSRKPEWPAWTRAARIAKVTAFITNYPAIRTARQQKGMDAALREAAAVWPETPDPVGLARAVQPKPIAEFPKAETPDLFTVNRQFNWNKPHGQWMNQLLKDIDAAKKAGKRVLSC